MTSTQERTNILRGVGARLAAPWGTMPALLPDRLTCTLADAVLAAVRNLPANSLSWFPKADQGLAYQGKVLLGLLTYCYAKEIYAATDIEDCMCRDASFVRLCNQEFPGALILRRFRRYNREAITHCLAEALRSVQNSQRAEVPAKPAGPPVAGGRSAPQTEASLDTWTEAHRRVETAVFVDHMLAEAE